MTAAQQAEAPAPTVPAIRLRGLTKEFGRTVAVHPTDLEVAPREFFSILGPSGCGKTTLMRMITGLEPPSGGVIELDGADVRSASTRSRDLNMVFQSYALFPHLDVYENVAFELRARFGNKGRRLPPRFAGRDIDALVREALDLVRLGPLARRRPEELSGGQRQRVALARAIVSRPSVVLLDEPLGALDQQLRKEMQFELTRLQREVGLTFVYVTHDQEEALTMSDRIAVMNAGRVLQVATPYDIYHRPADVFVAGFIGTCNLLRVTVCEGGGELAGIGILPATMRAGDPLLVPGSPAVLAVRPEAVSVSADPPEGRPGIRGVVRDVAFVGHEWRLVLDLGGDVTLAVTEPVLALADAPRPGREVWISWDAAQAPLLPAE